jgi:hypothetical protein
MSVEEVSDFCKDNDFKLKVNNLSNGRYDYQLKRVIRYKIDKKDSREVLVIDVTGFPTLNYEQKQ